jgi:hypothetical protein
MFIELLKLSNMQEIFSGGEMFHRTFYVATHIMCVGKECSVYRKADPAMRGGGNHAS